MCKLKVIIGAIALGILMIGAPSVYASNDFSPLPHSNDPQTAYQAGYAHGVADAKAGTDRCHWYILEPGHGFGFHTQKFNQGYVAGITSDADEATWDCPS